MNTHFRWGAMALLWASLPALGQRAATDLIIRADDKPYVQATGQATVSVQPDQALIDIGVVSQGTTAAAAATQNAKQTDAVMAELANWIKDRKKLKTTNYSVRPNYTYPKPGAAGTITGYTATNVVEVTLDDLTLISKVIDATTQSGANLIQRLQYQLKDPKTVRAQALQQAAGNAKVSADAMAAGLGLKITRVLSVEEAAPEAGMVMYKRAAPMAAAQGMAPATPVEIGTIDVDVTVVLRVEIGQ